MNIVLFRQITFYEMYRLFYKKMEAVYLEKFYN